jgi:radical SAM family uncharacterized protein/radical SAM-linked protein
MGYSNVLQMLKLGGVPLESRERRAPFPLVIAGGPCTVNPEPLARFVDAFVLGDGEEVGEELLDLFLRALAEGWEKTRLLEDLARIEGVYVPSFFHVEPDPDGSPLVVRPLLPGHDRVRRRIVASLDPLDYPTRGIVPYVQVIHDRVSLEIARGCTRGCRFCQAGFTYRPVRERSLDRVLGVADRALRETGYEDISLLSLSAGDYSEISSLMGRLTARYAPERVAISFPSLRVGSLSDEMLQLVKEVRKTGITVAPEAGTERLRRVVNKDIDEEEILETARRVFRQGWLSVKLYFMIGLPTETQEDLEGIVRLCERILAEGGVRKNRGKLHVSLSPFVPKPHTPFQWVSQLPLSETQARMAFLRRELKRKGIQVKWQDPHLSLLEGAFSRGDRRLGEVLLRAHDLGCRFDGWSEHMRFELWEKAFAATGIPLEKYVTRPFATEGQLPWDHLDMGVSREYLLEEYRRGLAGQRTPDCRGGHCQGCAVCDGERISVTLSPRVPLSPFPGMRAFESPYHRSKGQEIRRRFRVRYTKTGPARVLSHLELTSVMVRALRRAGVPLRFSQGFHPMPRMDFGPALPVGVESLDEYMDLEVFGFVEPAQVLEALRRELPEGLEPLGCEEVAVDGPSLFQRPSRVWYWVQVPGEVGPTGEGLASRISEFLGKDTCMVERVRKNGVRSQTLDVRPMVEAVTVESRDQFEMQILAAPEGGVRVLELAGAILGLEEPEVRRLRIRKTRVEGLERRSEAPGALLARKGVAKDHVL